MSKDLVHVTGQLTERAYIGTIPNTSPPEFSLVLHLQPAKGLPYVVVQPLGSDAAAYRAATAKLHLLRAGNWARFYATGFYLRHDHSTQALIAHGVTDVMPLDLPTNHTEAKPSPEASAC
jgi:hypothetical protein